MPPKSKPGEGIVVVVDVGPAVRASTETTFYSQAKTCLINILQRKIFAEKCKDMVGVVLFGTDETKNDLAGDGQYQHVTVMQRPKFVDWELLGLAERLQRGNTQGDWLDAIVVAMDLLHDPEEITFGTKKIVLMTDFNSEFNDDKAETIISGLRNMEIELSVIGPSIDAETDDMDATDGQEVPGPSTSNGVSGHRSHHASHLNWNGKQKTPKQLAAEFLIKRIVAEVDGIICSFSEAIPQLVFFEKKSQGSANWNAMMDIGPNFKIPVVGKIKVKHATPSTWKKTYVEDENAVIIPETSYHKKDEDQTVVSERDIISGYRFGTTLVPFGEEDAKLKYTCEVPGATLSVLGFTRAQHLPLNLRAGDQVMVVTAKDGDEDGAFALSALIQALKELDMVAVTRKVYRKNLNPVLGVLYPDITTDYECLIWVGIPFQEDIRKFTFPSLEKSLSKITDEQRELMDRLITDMDLSAKEDEEEPLDPTLVVNPQLQHYFNCLTKRALNPSDPIPAPEKHIMDILSPPEAQREARDALVAKLKEIFPTKKIDDYKKKKLDLFANADDRGDAATSNNAGVRLTSTDLTSVTVTKISTATPVQDFLAMLKGDQPQYAAICSQMSDVLLQLCECLSGDNTADRILVEKLIEGVKAFREEAKNIDPSPFNEFVRQFKQLVKARNFSDLWLVITQDNLGLITQTETLKSKVSIEEAEQFIKIEEEEDQQAAPPPVKDDVDYDDMLDDL